MKQAPQPYPMAQLAQKIGLLASLKQRVTNSKIGHES
jgi:hypothetical protein